MGTVVYHSLLKLLLDERDMTIEEILNTGEEKYGFDKERLAMETRLAIGLNFIPIIKLPSGKLHLAENGWEPSYFRELMLGQQKFPENYFNNRPKLKEFYEELNRRYGN